MAPEISTGDRVFLDEDGSVAGIVARGLGGGDVAVRFPGNRIVAVPTSRLRPAGPVAAVPPAPATSSPAPTSESPTAPVLKTATASEATPEPVAENAGGAPSAPSAPAGETGEGEGTGS